MTAHRPVPGTAPMVLLGILALLAGCAGVTVPSTPPSQEGVIVERNRPTSFSESRPTIWVKERDDEECGVIYLIGRRTDLVARRPDGALRQATLADLEVGARVRVWTDLIMTSCPGQATADAVEVQP